MKLFQFKRPTKPQPLPTKNIVASPKNEKPKNTGIWGPNVWNFMHTLCATIKEEYFEEMSSSIVQMIYSICSLLPCPDCSQHATNILHTNAFGKNIRTKQELIISMYLFHNKVNNRLNKPSFDMANLSKYESQDIFQVTDAFIKVFHTNGNMQQLHYSFHRKRLVDNIRRWIGGRGPPKAPRPIRSATTEAGANEDNEEG